MISPPLFSLVIKDSPETDIQNLEAMLTWVNFCCCKCCFSHAVLQRKLTHCHHMSTATNFVGSSAHTAWPGTKAASSAPSVVSLFPTSLQKTLTYCL